MTAASIIANRDYTIEEIDGHLKFISNIITIGRRTDKTQAFRRADVWLDKRLEVMKENTNA